MDSSLVDYLPLWRTFTVKDLTVLVTPALDYVAAVELTPYPSAFADSKRLAVLGESLRGFVSSLPDDTVLQFLLRVELSSQSSVRQYLSAHATAAGPLRDYCDARASWLAERPLRTSRLFLFVSQGAPRLGLGWRLSYAAVTAKVEQESAARLEALRKLRESVTGQLAAVGFPSRPLPLVELQQLYRVLLNPNQGGVWNSAPLKVRDNLFESPQPNEAELTEGEQLFMEDLVEEDFYLRQGKTYRGVVTLKGLPESSTRPLDMESILRISAATSAGGREPFAYWLATTLRVAKQSSARRALNARHGLVSALKSAIPLVANHSVAGRAADAAMQGSIEGLFAEFNAMSTKVVSYSAAVLLEASSQAKLSAQCEAVHAAFRSVGQATVQTEDVAQLQGFLSVLPGAGAYQFRGLPMTSRNAADLLPLWAIPRGSSVAGSLFSTTFGDAFAFDLFDQSLSPAPHGVIVSETGAGKSVAAGAIAIDLLATGVDAVLVDNGGSWKTMTELLGGVHLDVGPETPLAPFLAFENVVNSEGEVETATLDGVVSYLGLCLLERSEKLNKLQTQIVSKAVQFTYLSRMRRDPARRPVMSDFLAGFASIESLLAHADDRRICSDFIRRFALFVGDGLYAKMLDRPSALNFESQLLTFDMANVKSSPTVSTIAMATLMLAINARASKRRKRTLCVIDEAHTYLGKDPVVTEFLNSCYRVMRKYNVAMWLISQSIEDFGDPAIRDNAGLTILLKRASEHATVARRFGLSDRAEAAYKNLKHRKGYYSEFILRQGDRLTVPLRLELHPLAYWILTTDPLDGNLLAQARLKNPKLGLLQLLKGMAQQYPHGVQEANS